jgi:excisionase family DNA binding protein
MKTVPLPPIDANQRYSIQESTGYLRASRPTVSGLIAAGKLAVIREGRRIYIPGASIIALSRPTAA